jgi:oligopeptidase B
MRTLTVFLLVLVGSLMTDTASTQTTPTPPVARRVPHETVRHGDRQVDDYFWMREKSDPEVVAYLEAENAYAAAVMRPTEGLQKALYDEMLGRIQQTDLSVPYRKGGWWYYSRTVEGLQYPIYCRKPGTLEATEEVVLDLNEFGREHRFVGLGDYTVSDDGTRLAYSLDTTGFRQYTLRVKDLTTGRHGPEEVHKVANLTWAADGRTLFYTVEDPAKRHYRLYRHALGEPHAKDALVYEEKDERFELQCERTRSRGWLVLTAASHTTSEVRVLAADRPAGEWTLVAAREQGHEYYLDHHGERFWIRTNDLGRNFRLASAPVATPGRGHWREEIAHRPQVMLTGMDFFRHHRVLWEREDGLPRLAVTDLRTGGSHRIAMPEPGYNLVGSPNPEFDTARFRYGYTSFVTPMSVYEYDLDSRGSELLKRTEVLGGYDPARYVTERVMVTARDGTRVPVSLFHRRDLVRDGSAPALLYGYGSYGIAQFPSFNPNRLSLVDRGFVYALAHVRGGGEMGKAWHDAGRMGQKINTFTDFIDCAEWLVRERYTSPARLCIQGGSAGGLLMGAVLNMRPDLFRAALVQVPFVDVLNTMSDPSLPLTVGEFEEWGDPSKPADYAGMRRYSPYENLERRDYPAMLVKTSFNDSQVMYWEPAKYVARLRTLGTGGEPLLFKTNMAGGHGGSSGRYDALKDVAFDYAFLLARVGLAPPQ